VILIFLQAPEVQNEEDTIDVMSDCFSMGKTAREIVCQESNLFVFLTS